LDEDDDDDDYTDGHNYDCDDDDDDDDWHDNPIGFHFNSTAALGGGSIPTLRIILR
jgi:hypothetical protein